MTVEDACGARNGKAAYELSAVVQEREMEGAFHKVGAGSSTYGRIQCLVRDEISRRERNRGVPSTVSLYCLDFRMAVSLTET